MLHDFGFLKIDGEVIIQKEPFGTQDMEQCTFTNSPDSDVKSIQEVKKDEEES